MVEVWCRIRRASGLVADVLLMQRIVTYWVLWLRVYRITKIPDKWLKIPYGDVMSACKIHFAALCTIPNTLGNKISFSVTVSEDGFSILVASPKVEDEDAGETSNCGFGRLDGLSIASDGNTIMPVASKLWPLI
ncbi:hypothetical protein VNO77_27541 [Canavalia gladiata]|uniref:Uncharacterized protein n=1 Tax=Canavalia gladiata TaxID=3824 RepID=A0AAN9KVH7_CANGL